MSLPLGRGRGVHQSCGSSTQSSLPHRCLGFPASRGENKLVHRQFGNRRLLALPPRSPSCHPAPSTRDGECDHSHVQPHVFRGKRFFSGLIVRTLLQLAKHPCPHRSNRPPPLPPSLFQKSHSHFRDPRWKSNSINQIIAQCAVGIPTSLLHANEAGRGCGGEGGVWRRRGSTPQKLAEGGMRD